MEQFSADEHPRETTLEKLGSLKPVFKENGTVTAGNASVRKKSPLLTWISPSSPSLLLPFLPPLSFSSLLLFPLRSLIFSLPPSSFSLPSLIPFSSHSFLLSQVYYYI